MDDRGRRGWDLAVGQELLQSVAKLSTRYLTLPDRQHLPTCLNELCLMLPIALNISRELGIPKRCVALRASHDLACRVVMLVPKAAVDKDRFPATDHCDVWLARKVAPVKPVADAYLVKEAPNGEFGSRVFRPRPAHDA